jgi:medium-chain acyl-[acyl-carrier-protein] hydrolase
LPPEIESCAVQPPGRENRIRERPHTRLSELVAAAAEGLRPHLEKPFAFFGHSMGALVSFELARRLQAEEGPRPVHLFVSACRAPQLPDPHPPVHGFSDSEFLQEVRRRYDAIPAAVSENAELLQLLLPTLRADFEAFETYRYSDGPPLACPITCFGGVGDHEVTQGELQDWRSQTSAPFRLRMHPGGHFFLQAAERPLLDELAAELTAAIAGPAPTPAMPPSA